MDTTFHWYLVVEGIEIKKRSLMGKIANKNCKKIYVTDDNPRNEDPKKLGEKFQNILLKIKHLILEIEN